MPWSRRAFVISTAILAVSCSSGGGSHTTVPPTSPRSLDRPLAWAALRNPILSSADAAVKDPALVAFDGGWVVLYSRVDRAGVWRIGIARSRDLRTWSDITTMPHDPTVEGEASPDVTRRPDGAYVVTYQSSRHDRAGALSKVYARTTSDFRSFSAPIRLAANLHNGRDDRLIDAALAWSPAGLLLGYKLGTDEQHFEMARSVSGSLAGPWQLIGRPNISLYGDTVENYQFIRIDGNWTLLATSNAFDHPELMQLHGDASQPTGWLDWSAPRELQVPQERFNPGRGATGVNFEHANCAFLVDRRTVDGFFYLVYADAPEMSNFDAQGHAVLAIARSTDLVHWTVPTPAK
ncbi:MAG TPA: hypothetical protein VFR41_10705 [Acidimicrobiia bacterium]|nr:hypothetical protein [Acidimicrobiia bacterium]